MTSFWNTESYTGCIKCGLHKKVKSPKIPPFGDFKKKIMVMGEAPGGTEDFKNEPFCGDSGQLLRATLKELGIDFVKDCKTINSVGCRPSKGDANRTPTEEEIKLCRPLALQAIKQFKPKLLILLGGVACKSILSDKEIGKFHGYVIPDRELNCWIAPTFHPSKIMRSENWDPYIGELWVQELQNAISYLDEPFPEIPLEYEIGESIPQIEAYIERCFQNGLVVTDWENYPLKPYNNDSQLICGALSCDGTAITFPIEGHWSDRDFKRLRDGLADLHTSPDVVKVAHNIKHERMWAIEKLGFDFKPPFHDTMLMHYATDEREKTHSLEHLIWMVFGVKTHKQSVNKFKKDMRKCPKPLLFEYNAGDSIYEYYLFDLLFSLLEADIELCEKVYQGLLLRGTEATLASEMMGTLVGMDVMDELNDGYVKEVESLQSKIYKLPEVRKYLKVNPTFDVGSNQQVERFLFDFCKIESTRKTRKGKGDGRAVDNVALTEIGTEFCTTLIGIRKKLKLLDYVGDKMKVNIYDDGRFHTSYLLAGPETGRLASSDPNQQNFPKRENKEVRKIMVAPAGSVILMNDYSQWEVCGIQMYARDPNLGYAIEHGVDFHGEYAKRLFNDFQRYGSIDDPKLFKKYRFEAKNCFIFPTVYKASSKSCAGYLKLPYDHVEPIQRQFLEEYHFIKEWQDKLIHDYSVNGYVKTLMGRRRRAPITINQLCNSPVQGLCSDFTLLAWCKLNELEENRIIPPIMIHDDLTAYVPEKGWNEYYEIIKWAMTEWDFEWINVPIRIESKVGYDACEAYPVEEFLN